MLRKCEKHIPVIGELMIYVVCIFLLTFMCFVDWGVVWVLLLQMHPNAWISSVHLNHCYCPLDVKDLTFKQHVSSICKKVNNQLSVMTRFGKLMSTETMLRLYKAFILPQF